MNMNFNTLRTIAAATCVWAFLVENVIDNKYLIVIKSICFFGIAISMLWSLLE
ncbi:MAG: hypothetical protein LBT51_10545 [Fusobacteriaceae bacterium]|jgi:hypothetical protein|nr:hypothetical protein [Fusobacteriaceae bacterium]